MRNKTVDNYSMPDQDNPSETGIEVGSSLMELDEILQQRLDNVPKGIKSLEDWKKDVNYLVDEINTILGFKKYKRV